VCSGKLLNYFLISLPDNTPYPPNMLTPPQVVIFEKLSNSSEFFLDAIYHPTGSLQ